MPTSNARRQASRARCRIPDCKKFAQTRKLCKAHGGGSLCHHPGCQKLAQSRGLCIAHGGGRRCAYDGCTKLAQSKGYCISHGGGRRCHVIDCDKFAQVRGHCKLHSKLIGSSSSWWSPVSVSGSPSDCVHFQPTILTNSFKLSIDFLISPRSMVVERKEEVSPRLQVTYPPLPHQRSLLSYLDPTTSAMIQTRSWVARPSHYRPLELHQ